MLNVDEFESVFRAADKKQFHVDPPAIERVLVVSDVEGEEEQHYLRAIQTLLGPLGDDIAWVTRGKGTWSGVEELLHETRDIAPDMVVAYRNLYSDAWGWSYSLGVYLSALTRGTPHPVLVTPNPHASRERNWYGAGSRSVMVITNHLTGDDRLVNWGIRACHPEGSLRVMHMENDQVYARYVEAISKIPEIDTESASEQIKTQLVREPTDYMDTVRQYLARARTSMQFHGEVAMGHRVADYKQLIERHNVNLLVFPTLEEDCIALDGIAYSLAVELVDTPLLMI